MNLSPSEVQQVRTVPFFARLTEDQLECLADGTVVEAPGGTVLASEGQRTGFFEF